MFIYSNLKGKSLHLLNESLINPPLYTFIVKRKVFLGGGGDLFKVDFSWEGSATLSQNIYKTVFIIG